MLIKEIRNKAVQTLNFMEIWNTLRTVSDRHSRQKFKGQGHKVNMLLSASTSGLINQE